MSQRKRKARDESFVKCDFQHRRCRDGEGVWNDMKDFNLPKNVRKWTKLQLSHFVSVITTCHSIHGHVPAPLLEMKAKFNDWAMDE
jgi:hypothetical protein